MRRATPVEFAALWRGQFAAGGPWPTRVFSQKLGALLAWLASRAGLGPNAVTGMALLTSVSGSVVFATATGVVQAFFACALWQFAYALDCADGQLARSTGCSSRVGMWWDVSCDFGSLIALSMALAWVMLGEWGLSWLIMPLVGWYLGGRCLGLFSSTMARQWRVASQQAPAKSSSRLRGVYMGIIDTPTQLFVLAVMRFEAEALMVWLLVFGSMAMLHGVLVGYSAAREVTSAGQQSE